MSAEQPGGWGLPNDLSALERYTEEYAYDAVGNIDELKHTSPSTNWTRLYAYVPGSNRLEKTYGPSDLPGTIQPIPYDPHGSMLRLGEMQTMGWDYADRLTSADLGGGGEVYFTYDAAGQRVRKVRERNNGNRVDERIYLGGFEIYRRWDGPIGDVGTTLEVERETLHVMDDQRRIAMVETKNVDPGNLDVGALNTPRWRFQLGNHLDSAALELDEAAGILSYEEYHPYGSTAFHTAKGGAEVSDKRYRYTGKERDEETGLYYHGARYYAVWLGRWTAADPAGLIDGLNLYRYSRDNPINFSDPGGTEASGREEELGMSIPDEHVSIDESAEPVGLTVDPSGEPALISASGGVIPRSPSVDEVGYSLPKEENKNAPYLLAFAPSPYVFEQQLMARQMSQVTAARAVPSRLGLGVMGLGLLAVSDTPLADEVGGETKEGEPEKVPLYIFRGMKELGGMPEIGPGARTLGVRADWDIPVSPQGLVSPGSGGMSVAPGSPYSLPEHRRPPGFGGTGKDPVWALKVEDLGHKLHLDIDSLTHGTVQPMMSMDVVDFESALGETAPLWQGPMWSPVGVK